MATVKIFNLPSWGNWGNTGGGGEGTPGPAGPQGPKGDTGAAGPAGPKGDTGAAGAAGPKGDTGAAGPAGPKGDQGIQGEQGIQGAAGLGITFKGNVATEAELPSAGQVQGDLWVVTTPAPATSRIWDAGTTAWVNGGPVQGPQGIAGPQGIPGTDSTVPGPTGPKGDTGAQGVAGPKGDNGVAGPAGPTAIATATVLGGVKVGTGLAVDADGLLSASGGGGGGLPTTGGTMTGAINLPTTVQSLNWGSNYNVFGGTGGVAVRYNAANIVTFTATSANFAQKITTPGTGQGIEFGSGGGYLSKVGTGIGAYCGGAQVLSIGAAEITAKVPVLLPADPTVALQAAPKQYVDAKPTIVAMPAGATPPDSALYANNTLLVEFAA